MEQQVTQVLQQAFQGMNAGLFEMFNGKLSKPVIREGFGEQDTGDRQDLMRMALEEAHGAKFQQVGVLLTYTPREMMLMLAA